MGKCPQVLAFPRASLDQEVRECWAGPHPLVTHCHGLLDGGALYLEPDTHILGHLHGRLRERKTRPAQTVVLDS